MWCLALICVIKCEELLKKSGERCVDVVSKIKDSPVLLSFMKYKLCYEEGYE
ncbi:MAG: hypothetical protein DGJ47_000688 [Rickettsiaceae bacterium]